MRLNKVQLMGRLGKDPVKHTTNNGKTYSTFSVAVEKKVKEEKKTLWFFCRAWGKVSDIALQYLKKGAPIWLDGEIDMSNKTHSDGTAYTVMAVNVHAIQMLPDGRQAPRESGNVKAAPPVSTNVDFGGTDFNKKQPNYASDDLPF